VPWDNNAETAIKAFAIYKKQTDKLPTQKGVEEYLTLVSIGQICKYRNLSFFEFLNQEKQALRNFLMKRV
jgi:hypothetical protein